MFTSLARSHLEVFNEKLTNFKGKLLGRSSFIVKPEKVATVILK